MPKIFKKEDRAGYETQIVKLASVQVNLDIAKSNLLAIESQAKFALQDLEKRSKQQDTEFQILKVKLDRETRLFQIMLYLGFCTLLASIWQLLK